MVEAGMLNWFSSFKQLPFLLFFFLFSPSVYFAGSGIFHLWGRKPPLLFFVWFSNAVLHRSV